MRLSKGEGESARQGRQPAGEPVGDPAAVCEKGSSIKAIPKTVFPRHTPSSPAPVRPPSSFRPPSVIPAPFSHSGPLQSFRLPSVIPTPFVIPAKAGIQRTPFP